WTQGAEVKFNSMEIPKNITVAGFGDTIMADYNKTVYKYDEEKKTYYKEGTSLNSTSYVRKVDLAIPMDGLYFKNGKPLPGQETTVITKVENVGDLTAKGIKVSLYDGDTLIAVKDMKEAQLSHGNSVLASFDWQVPENYSGFNLRAVLEAANDSNSSNNTAQLKVLYSDAEITRVDNELFAKNSGVVYVDVKNAGYSSIENAKVQLSTDKEFKNIIDTKEIKELKPFVGKTVVFDVEPSDEQLLNRARIYAKVETSKEEYSYLNNSDFTILRPFEGYLEASPTPSTTPDVSPTPTPTPTPTTGGSAPVGNSTPNPTQDGTPTPSPTPDTTPGQGETTNPPVAEPTPEIPSAGEVGKFKAYMRGYSDNTFRPEQSLTRAEMAVIIANLDGVSKGNLETTEFKDVPKNHWAAWAISYVLKKGYFKGYEDNTYRPNKYITRAELSTVLCKYLNLQADVKNDNKFTDINNHWAKGFINKLISKGYIKGYPDGTFKPDSNIKRSECVSLINRMMGIKPLKDSEIHFTDVDKNHWAFNDITAATMGGSVN
ncbi:MAG: S-layer homology domain-containing protein, partial [Bacillota bacterium]|nr:S-layer homology domain-containing protein [Bacillota bacterium]